jgi:hypothetical protein
MDAGLGARGETPVDLSSAAETVPSATCGTRRRPTRQRGRLFGQTQSTRWWRARGAVGDRPVEGVGGQHDRGRPTSPSPLETSLWRIDPAPGGVGRRNLQQPDHRHLDDGDPPSEARPRTVCTVLGEGGGRGTGPWGVDDINDTRNRLRTGIISA